MEFGGSSPISHYRPHVPNCCKMWFPMTETGGSGIIDIAGGCKLVPTSMSFETSGAIRVKSHAGGVGHFPAAGLELESGTFPVIGTKNFILFAVQRYSNALGRANAYVMLNDTDGGYLGIFDGDGVQISNGVGTCVSGTETFAGADGYPNYSSNAIVRDGDSLGDWVMPATVSDPVAQGNTVGTGDIYGRVCRNAGYNPSTPGTYGQWSRNDYGIPDAIIENWQVPAVTPTMLSWGEYTFGTSVAGLPGVWPYIDPTYSVGTIDRIQIGQGLDGHNDYYGIALFVFDGALPPDFKEALRWMNDEWIAGNKVIWPAWANL